MAAKLTGINQYSNDETNLPLFVWVGCFGLAIILAFVVSIIVGMAIFIFWRELMTPVTFSG